MRSQTFEQFKYYPTPDEIDTWITSIWSLVEVTSYDVEVMNRNGFDHSLGVNHVGASFTYVKFNPFTAWNHSMVTGNQ